MYGKAANCTASAGYNVSKINANNTNYKTYDSEEKLGVNTGMEEKPETQREHNVSFSFNLDLNEMSNGFYSDSDGELEIDVSEIDNNNDRNDRKRKREMDKDASVFNEMEEEIERQLDAKAAKTNLTAKNVKNILKHVITNEHVMAMVKREAYNVVEDVIFEPKLTRAKAKELAMSQPDIPWPITPVKKLKGSEVQVLIESELPEDSSDEEYKPGQDEPSDDERETPVSSDIDSQPATPSVAWVEQNTAVEEIQPEVRNVKYDVDGIFKIPGIPQDSVQCENIGQRTRSKLSLSETPLEQIEQAFVPPDITTDMYDWGVDADEDWNNFLKEFTQPLPQEINGEDDPEADPEYNILEDEETDLLDKEELRMDKAVKVTRKELNTLVAELFEFADMFSRENQDSTKKKKPCDVVNATSENATVNGSFIELLPALSEPELPRLINSEQRSLLEVQLCQHVQLVVQHFFMTHMHPEFNSHAKQCKNNLYSFRYLENGENSAFNVLNLTAALEVINEWESRFDEPNFEREFVKFISEEISVEKLAFQSKLKYIPRFHPEVEKFLMKSEALIYPHLLPEIPFRCVSQLNHNTKYLVSEQRLIAMGLEQFTPFVASKITKFKSKVSQLMDTADLIHRYLIPIRKSNRIMKYIEQCLKNSKTKINPIRDWRTTGKIPPIKHCFIPVTVKSLKAPRDQPRHMLPIHWKNLKVTLPPENDTVRRRLLNVCKDLSKSLKIDENKLETYSDSTQENINSHVLNPIINMMPGLPSLDTPLKDPVLEKTENSTPPPLPKLAPNAENNQHHLPKTVDNVEPPLAQTSNRGQNASSIHTVQKATTESRMPRSCKSVELDSKSESSLRMDLVKDEQFPTNSIHMPDIKMFTPPKKISHTVVIDAENLEKATTTPPRNINQQSISNQDTNSSDRESSMEQPALRKTTPRLAKIRSAQNMKMMAQILGSKGLSPNTSGIKPRNRKGCLKNSEEPSTSNSGDNEDEIAELMLASTTIKKDTALRKRAKQARELENIKRLIEAENDLSQEERATKFAVSFLQKLHRSLDFSNPEIFKAIIKLFLDFNEKIDNLNPSDNEESLQTDQQSLEKASSASEQLSEVLLDDNEQSKESEAVKSKDVLTIELYQEICEKLDDYPELQTDFLIFLKPHQAAMIGKSVEHTMLQKMTDFVDIAQIYFAKQPSRLSKVMQAITQLASEPCVTLDKVHSVMNPLLKGHPLVMDAFLQVLPTGKPPESLFAPHMFENLTCPPGPHDKNKIYSPDAPELYENIEMPVSTSQEDPYGGDNCKCDCHNIDDQNLKSRSDHCVSCGTRFLNGRIYLQTSEGLRPAKVEFPGSPEEKREHIARVSLKTTERFEPTPPTRRSRKSSKNSPDQELKRNKNSPAKDLEESDKSLSKTKKVGKIQMKSKERKKSPKNLETSPKFNASEKKESTSPVKTKREERAEKREAQDYSRSKQARISPQHTEKSDHMLHLDVRDEDMDEAEKDEPSADESSVLEGNDFEITPEDTETSINETEPESNISLEKMDVSSDSCSDPGSDHHVSINIKPWTRQEDAVLLECIKKDYSENTFLTISETLGDRTVQQVKERFQVLLSLLEKMG